MTTIEIAVPGSWTPGQTLAVRALLQKSLAAGYPIVSVVRPDATACRANCSARAVCGPPTSGPRRSSGSRPGGWFVTGS